MSLLNKKGLPSKALLKLAQQHGIECDGTTTAEELSAAMQERWLRKTEHQYQVPEGPPEAPDMHLLNELGMVQEVRVPKHQCFTGALLLGATVTGVRRRLAHIVSAEKETIAREMILRLYMLGGERLLDPEKESPDILLHPGALPFRPGWKRFRHLPKTEADMMHLVTLQSDIPPWPTTCIFTPLQPTKDGGMRDPNTTDTVREMLKTDPPPGRYLVVSSQPFVTRQTINVQEALPKGFYTVGVGPAAADTTPLKTFLDEIARLLYAELNARTA